MAEDANVAAESAKAAETEVVAKPKVNRRGIGSARGTTRLKFDHKMALPNGLFLGHIDDVKVTDVTIGEETTGMPSFNGMSIPRFTITFASNEEDANKRKYNTLTFMAVESNAETIPGGKGEWKVNQVFDYIKHILNVFVFKGRELSAEEEAALSLDFEDFDEEGNYVPVDSEVVVEAWRKFYNNVSTMLNHGRDGAPVYKTKDNKFIQIYGKMLRCIKTKKGWQNVSNGDLAFPSFVGEGVFEIYKQNAQPALRVDAVRESIIPRVADSAKKPNMPAATMPGMGAGVMVGSEMGGIIDPMAGPDGIALEAMEDSPF